MPIRTEIEYCYRDYDNYKCYGRQVFANPDVLPLPLIQQCVATTCTAEGHFIADQVGVPELFPWLIDGTPSTADHCWHELVAIDTTDATPTDPRPIGQFLADMSAAAQRGWLVFEPDERLLHGFVVGFTLAGVYQQVRGADLSAFIATLSPDQQRQLDALLVPGWSDDPVLRLLPPLTVPAPQRATMATVRQWRTSV